MSQQWVRRLLGGEQRAWDASRAGLPILGISGRPAARPRCDGLCHGRSLYDVLYIIPRRAVIRTQTPRNAWDQHRSQHRTGPYLLPIDSFWILRISVAMRQDPEPVSWRCNGGQERVPSQLGPSGPKPERRPRPLAPRHGGNSRGPRHLRTGIALAEWVAGNRWGIVRIQKGRRARSASVVSGDGHGEAGFGSIGLPGASVGYRVGTGRPQRRRAARPPKREAVQASCGAGGGNRADRCDDGPPGRALAPVRTPVRKIAPGGAASLAFVQMVQGER